MRRISVLAQGSADNLNRLLDLIARKFNLSATVDHLGSSRILRTRLSLTRTRGTSPFSEKAMRVQVFCLEANNTTISYLKEMQSVIGGVVIYKNWS